MLRYKDDFIVNDLAGSKTFVILLLNSFFLFTGEMPTCSLPEPILSMHFAATFSHSEIKTPIVELQTQGAV